jgi:hypothetical protein
MLQRKPPMSPPTSPLVPPSRSPSSQAERREKIKAADRLSILSFLVDLVDVFGWKLLVVLVTCQHILKGFVLTLCTTVSTFLFASYNVSGPSLQVFTGILMLPFAMKPALGIMSDTMPIGGFKKSPYILGFALLGGVAMLVLALVPREYLPISAVVLLLFAVSCEVSLADLLSEATYGERLQDRPEQGPNVLAFVWFGMTVAGLFATVPAGIIISTLGVKLPFLITFCAGFVVIPVMATNCMEEKRMTREEVAEARRVITSEQGLTMLCFLVLFGSVAMMAVGLLVDSVPVNASVGLVVAVVTTSALVWVLEERLAKVCVFMICQSCLNISIAGASFYFFTDPPEAFPNGPNLTPQFFATVLGSAGSLCSLVGIVIYRQYMRNWTYRGLLVVANLIVCAASLLDIVLFTHANRRLGIPDHWFVLGSTGTQSIVQQWQWMPTVVLISQLCPKGMAATIYALLAGCSNLGNAVAQTFGAYVLYVFGVSPCGAKDESAQFDNLWKCSLISSALPLVALVGVVFLIPDACMTDSLSPAASVCNSPAASPVASPAHSPRSGAVEEAPEIWDLNEGTGAPKPACDGAEFVLGVQASAPAPPPDCADVTAPIPAACGP